MNLENESRLGCEVDLVGGLLLWLPFVTYEEVMVTSEGKESYLEAEKYSDRVVGVRNSIEIRVRPLFFWLLFQRTGWPFFSL